MKVFKQLYSCYFFQVTDVPAWRNHNYPVLLFIHGENFNLGDSQLYPGHILAQKEIIVVTFNYRLGALGMYSHCYCLNLIKITLLNTV